MDALEFNKEKLLSAKSADEFNLYLPNPKLLVDCLIQNDDVEMFAKYYGNLSYLLDTLAIYVKSDVIENLFKAQSVKIISFISQVQDENFEDEHVQIEDNLSKYSLDFTSEQLKYFHNMYASKRMYYEIYKDCVKIDKKVNTKIIPYIKYSTETLLDFDSLDSKSDIFVEYLKWLIEFAMLMPKVYSQYGGNSGDLEYVFWHPDFMNIKKYKKIPSHKLHIQEKLKLYSNVINYVEIHNNFGNEFNCKFCDEFEFSKI